MNKKILNIAIQGIEASFHDVAARMYFGQEINPIKCSSFSKLFESLAQGKADFAVMAIENALAGSILPNYALMEKFRFKILGEVYLKIEMCLMCLPGETINDIKVVQSHPMAILQCQDFLSSLHGIKIMEHADTAESAKEIKTRELHHHAAIASRLAAQTFELNLLNENIETNSANVTRFLIICRHEDYKRAHHTNKASLCFEAKHVPGSLAHILNLFEKYNLNMTKIQSLPIIGRPYHYAFHIDLEWDDVTKYEAGLIELNQKTLNLIHFGEYASGGRPTL